MKVGDKVVCIDDCGKSKWDFVCQRLGYHVNWPIKNEIYTLRSIREDGVSVTLEEIVNAHGWFRETATGRTIYEEAHFHINHFRPIDYSFGEELCEKLEQVLEPACI